jgi:hypothetical protein
MTFITKINTPSSNLISFSENSILSELVITGSTIIRDSLFVSNVPTSSICATGESINLNCATVSCSSGLTITGSINDYTVDDFFIIRPSSLSTSRRVGIGTLTPSAQLHVSGTSDFHGNFNVDNMFYFNSSNGRIGINTTSPSYNLHVNGNFSCGTGSPYGATFKTVDSTGFLGINTDSPSAKLHIFGSTVPNKIIDTDALIVTEKTSRGVFQIITAGASSYGGIMFSAATLLSGAPSNNKHWSVFASWGGAPGGYAYDTGSIFTRAPAVGDLCFAYYAGSNTAPFLASIAGDIISPYTYGVFGYLKFDEVVNEINFTGQHRNNPSDNNLQFYADKIGLIVVSEGTYSPTIDINDSENTTISINESLPKVGLSNIRNDKKVFGVISEKEEEQIQTREIITAARWGTLVPKKQGDHRLIINSVGEGGIWVCNINGNLENGDYITTCEIPGFGMKQDTDDLCNYTVAKITCDCSFDLSSQIYKCEEIEFNGSTYRKAFVGCTYHCG